MAAPVTFGQPPEIEYPDSDGQPMSDNTLQFQWIVTLQGNLDALFRDDPNVFVAGDLLWYPVQKRADIRAAPDALVVFGRPKGYRGSYKQWEEGGIAPQVVFEVLSPGNRTDEMNRKLQFYDTHSVEEYYLYDPDHVVLTGWCRVGAVLQPIPVMHNWVSPRLKIRFDTSGPELVIYDPKGQRFLTFLEQQAQREAARKLAEQERQQREKAEQQARDEQLLREKAEQQTRDEQRLREKAEQQTRDEQRLREKAEQQARDEQRLREKAEQQLRRLAEQLRAAGLDPDALPGAPEG